MSFLKKLFSKDKPRQTTHKGSKSNAPRKAAKAEPQSPVDAILQEQNPERLRELISAINSDTDLERLIREGSKAARAATEEIWLARIAPNGTLPTGANDEMLIRIASLSADPVLSQNAIAAIKEESRRADIAISHGTARVRLAAAETITDAALLHDLQKKAQGKDKAVYRFAKDKLAEYHKLEEVRQKLLDEAEYIRTNTETLLRLGYGPEFTGKLQVLKQRWQDLSTRDDAPAAGDIPELLSKADALLTEVKEAEQREAEQLARQQEAEQRQQTQVSHLKELLDSVSADSTAEGLKAALLSEEQAWAAATADISASATLQKRYDTLVADLTLVLTTLQYHENTLQASEGEVPELNTDAARKHLEHIEWPQSIEAPEWLTALRKLAGKKEAPKPRPAAADDSAAKQEVEALLKTLEQALEEHKATEAADAVKRINRLKDSLTAKSLNQIDGRLRLLLNQLNELRDWQGFAVTPKKEALCAQMEELVGADIAPDLLADRIKELQSEWKTLGHSNDRELWARFQEASDKAYEPCKAWFAEQAEQRAKLVTLREQLISELTRYEAEMNWESADWKVVQNTLNAARDTFKTYSPVDRGSHQRTQKAFNTACDAIYAHLKAEYDRNLAAKKAIVDSAEKIATAEDLSGAADAIKKLQQDWKTVGVTPRGPDQKLWTALRKNADAVFSRLNEARDARKAEINETVSTAEAIVKAAVEATEDKAKAISDARDQLRNIELPKGAQVRLSKELDDLDQAQRDAQQAARNAAAKEKWQTLLDSLNKGATPDGDLPAGIDAGWFSQEKSDESDARKLCITMEILAETESPEEDRTARMELQVQRLAEGLGKGRSKEEERAELIRQWLATQADDAASGRFVKALEATL